MNWAEFKRQMEAAGVKDSDEIEYIDTGCGNELDIERHIDPNGLVSVAVVD